MTMTHVPLCKDCKWVERDLIHKLTGMWEYALCAHPTRLNLVDGKASAFCSLERENVCRCGPEGKFFIPKVQPK